MKRNSDKNENKFVFEYFKVLGFAIKMIRFVIILLIALIGASIYRIDFFKESKMYWEAAFIILIVVFFILLIKREGSK